MKGKLPSKSTGITTLNTKLEKSYKPTNSNGHPSFITTYLKESILYFLFYKISLQTKNTFSRNRYNRIVIKWNTVFVQYM